MQRIQGYSFFSWTRCSIAQLYITVQLHCTRSEFLADRT